MSQWSLLEMYAKEIDGAIGNMIDDENALSETSFHLGKGVYVTVNRVYPTVDVRQRWKVPDTGDVVPTKKGISLTYDKWESLKETFPEVRQAVPNLEESVPCIFNDDHQNQEGMLQCSLCNPFGDMS